MNSHKNYLSGLGSAELRARRAALTARLPQAAGFLPGSLVEQRTSRERQAIMQALADAHDCRSRAAAALGVSRVTLYNKLKKYGIG